MVRHHTRALSFEVPPEWTANIAARFSPSSPEPHARGITVAREPLGSDETVRVHADKALLRISRDAPRFEFVHTQDIVVGGRPAVLTKFKLGPATARVEQTVVIVDPGDDPGRNLTILSCAAAGPIAEETALVFDEMLRTIRFAQPAPARPSRPKVEPGDSPSLFVPIPGEPERR